MTGERRQIPLRRRILPSSDIRLEGNCCVCNCNIACYNICCHVDDSDFGLEELQSWEETANTAVLDTLLRECCPVFHRRSPRGCQFDVRIIILAWVQMFRVRTSPTACAVGNRRRHRVIDCSTVTDSVRMYLPVFGWDPSSYISQEIWMTLKYSSNQHQA